MGISPEKVRAEVDRFWQILCGKSNDKLEGLYSSSAVVFTGKGKAPEAASLAMTRRARHLGEPGTDSSVELGLVEVQAAGTDVAIASYTYKFQRAQTSGDGGRLERNTLFGRATQVFQLDNSGALWIVHEHLSAGTNPEAERAAKG